MSLFPDVDSKVLFAILFWPSLFTWPYHLSLASFTTSESVGNSSLSSRFIMILHPSPSLTESKMRLRILLSKTSDYPCISMKSFLQLLFWFERAIITTRMKIRNTSMGMELRIFLVTPRYGCNPAWVRTFRVLLFQNSNHIFIVILYKLLPQTDYFVTVHRPDYIETSR